MIATNRWQIGARFSPLWKSQRRDAKRKPLVDALTSHAINRPIDRRTQIDFPPKPVLHIKLGAEWVSTRIRAYVRSLTDETKVLVTQLTDADAAVNTERAWEVDLLRGVTILLMVLIHVIPMTAAMTFLWIPLTALRLLFYGSVGVLLAFWGLSSSTVKETDTTTASAKWGRRGLNALALLTAWFLIHGTQSRILIEMFAGIMGISLLLGYENRRRRTGQAPSFRQQVSRALPLIIEGTLLAISFSFFGPVAGILASLLAMLGLSQILAYPFLSRSRWLSFTAGVAAFSLVSVPLVAALTPNLIYPLLGIPLASSVYSSFLPWFGATLLGVFIGKTLYDEGERRFELPDVAQKTPLRQLVVIGQHAHLIFLLHLPVTATWPLYTNTYAPALKVVSRPYPFKFI